VVTNPRLFHLVECGKEVPVHCELCNLQPDPQMRTCPLAEPLARKMEILLSEVRLVNRTIGIAVITEPARTTRAIVTCLVLRLCDRLAHEDPLQRRRI
jgi:hypothetical protein